MRQPFLLLVFLLLLLILVLFLVMQGDAARCRVAARGRQLRWVSPQLQFSSLAVMVVTVAVA